MSQTKAQLISGTTAQDLTVDNINTTSVNNGQPSGRKNLIINGAMNIAQRGTTTTQATGFLIDRFNVENGGIDENSTVTQADVASGTTPYTLGFRKALKIQNGNQTGGAGTNDYIQIYYRFEAQDIRTSGWNYTSASSFVTLSFWVKSSVAQVFSGSLRTRDGTSMSYKFDTPSLSADTWTKVTYTIPGNSNLQFDNNVEDGLNIFFYGFLGTTFTTSNANTETWITSATDTYANNMTTTWYTTNDATLEVTGMQFEVGSTATDFEHRLFGDELALCQRYFTAIDADGSIDNYAPIGIGRFYNSTLAQIIIYLPTTMRLPPTIDATFTTAADTFSMNSGGGFSAHALNSLVLNERSFNAITLSVGSAGITGQTTGMATTLYVDDADTAKLGLTAEL